MPTIQLKFSVKKKKNYPKTKCDNHIAVYNTTTWRELRLQYLAENPLCESCKKAEKLTLATDVHHKFEISNGKTIEEKKIIGFDYDNLMSLCKECHINIHK